MNEVTNKINIANFSSNNVTVIDGATNGTTTANAGRNPFPLAVNPATNKSSPTPPATTWPSSMEQPTNHDGGRGNLSESSRDRRVRQQDDAVNYDPAMSR